ncbi:MAG: hypothetical protein AB8G96_12395 [Phycisphaerales bacterium]
MERAIDRQFVLGAIMLSVPLAAGLALTTLPAGGGVRAIVGHVIRTAGLTGAMACIAVLLALLASFAWPVLRLRRRALLVIGSLAASVFAAAWIIGRLV